MRLQVYLSRCGLGSRRGCESIIEDGRVNINGQTVRQPGSNVQHNDQVKVDGRIVEPVPLRYVLLNKPKGVISVDKDPKGRTYVVDLVPRGREDGLFPVGRLDVDTTGLMILTNDGQLSNRIAHPRYGVSKVYSAIIKGQWEQHRLKELLENGVKLNNGETVEDVEVLRSKTVNGSTRVSIRIHEGRKHIVKRIFLSIGSRVLGLNRDSIGKLELKGLRNGEFRELNKHDIEDLAAVYVDF